MIFLTIFVWKHRKFYDSPFLSINKLSLMTLIYIFWYLPFIDFDSKIWNTKSAYTFHQIYIDYKTCEQC